MRISDWSSDVCSSDLSIPLEKIGRLGAKPLGALRPRGERRIPCQMAQQIERIIFGPACIDLKRHQIDPAFSKGIDDRAALVLNRPLGTESGGRGKQRPHLRSEEHTSELQSLMRISYAVFCLKKKNTKYK